MLQHGQASRFLSAPKLRLCRPHEQRLTVKAALDAGTAVRPLDVSRRTAWSRSQESKRPDALFIDPYADVLLGSTPPGGLVGADARRAALDTIATRYCDECVLNALAAVNTSSINGSGGGEYRQVVLLGDGMDTRPFRLPWPSGTVIFSIAPAETHELAEALLSAKAAQQQQQPAAAAAGAAAALPARVPRGCLLRRVNADLQGDASFMEELSRCGYRGDRLSVWLLQGVAGLRLGGPQLASLLADMSNSMAFHSLVAGELPAMGSRQEAENALAEQGLLSVVLPAHGGPQLQGYNRWQAGWDWEALAPEERTWLFSSQAMRLSLEQTGVFQAHAADAAEHDEDLPPGIHFS